MKKIVSGLCVLAILMVVAFGGITTAAAGTYEEECDLVFLKAFEQIISDEGITVENIEIIKDPVYDLSLEQLGYIYTMNIADKEGYALIINTDGIFDVTEIYVEAANPYNGYEGKNVYASLFLYLVWQDDQFIETSTGLVLDNDMFDMVQEKAFCASSATMSTGQEAIYYTNRVVNNYELAKRHPGYIAAGLSNACTPAAGGNIIGYYTRFYPELMPGFIPGNSLGNYYLYKEEAAETTPLMNTLYNYMDTNKTAPGTTIAEFRQGMTRFCNEKGRNISYNSCMQGSNFNYDITKQRFEQGMPVVLFVDSFKVVSMMNNSALQFESMNYTIGYLLHAMAGFGYNEITYTLTNGQTRTDRYIAVATGLGSHNKGYYNFSYGTQIDEVYAINIY